MASRKPRKERIVCISLRPDGTVHAEPDSVVVRRGNVVRWVTIVRDAKLGISFKKKKGSPFTDKGFSSPSRGQVVSAPVREDAEYGKYPYTISLTIGKCELTLDPDVDVQR